jgi:hypothetical protein
MQITFAVWLEVLRSTLVHVLYLTARAPDEQNALHTCASSLSCCARHSNVAHTHIILDIYRGPHLMLLWIECQAQVDSTGCTVCRKESSVIGMLQQC